MILDLMLINEEWEDVMRDTTVQHLARTSSDHAPLLISLKKNDILGPRYFKYLDFWVEHKDFITIVKEI